MVGVLKVSDGVKIEINPTLDQNSSLMVTPKWEKGFVIILKKGTNSSLIIIFEPHLNPIW